MTKKMFFSLLEFAKLHRCQCAYRTQCMILKTRNSLQCGPYRESCQQRYVSNGSLPKDFWVLISHPIVSDLLKLIFSDIKLSMPFPDLFHYCISDYHLRMRILSVSILTSDLISHFIIYYQMLLHA